MLECKVLPLSLLLPSPLLVVLAFSFEFRRCEGVVYACLAKSEAEFDSEYVVYDCTVEVVSFGAGREHSSVWAGVENRSRRSAEAESKGKRKERKPHVSTPFLNIEIIRVLA